MITMKDIAKSAGVSRTTVSFILNDSPKAKLISNGTREKVLRSAKELGYRPNLLARSVATGKTKVIGLISGSPKPTFMSKIFTGLISGMEKNGYLMKFIGLDDKNSEDDFLDIALEHQLAGIITIGYPKERVENLHNLLKAHHIPYCVLANSFPVSTGIRVISDDIQGGMIAVDHLVEHGHKKIAFFGHNPNSGTSVLREQGYLAGLSKHGLSPIIPESEGNFIEFTKTFLTERPDVTAVFAITPNMAANVIKAARRVGRSVPDDLSVVGYAQTELTKWFDPKITTISQHHVKMGETAATELIRAIESKNIDRFDTPQNHLIPVSLVLGESVGIQT